MNDHLDDVVSGLTDIADFGPKILKTVESGEKQAKARDAVIDTINSLCDTLQYAGDLVSDELSSSIMEYQSLRYSGPQRLYAFLERLTVRLSGPALRNRLHEGQVCGNLYKLLDRFRQPFNTVTPFSVDILQWLATLFRRSNNMSRALNGLEEGEQHYLRHIASILNQAREKTEEARMVVYDTQDVEGTAARLRSAGDALVDLLRQNRREIESKFHSIRIAGDTAIKSLH
jgi:hypothetical protein